LLLKPSKFYFLDSPKVGPKSIGFIAQDVENVFPELVKEFKQDKENNIFKGLSYDDFAVLSIQAIIDLNSKFEKQLSIQNNEIENLKSANNQLKSDYNELKKELEAIKQSLK